MRLPPRAPRPQIAAHDDGVNNRVTRLGNALLNLPFWGSRWLAGLVVILAAIMAGVAAITPLQIEGQLLFAAVTLAVALLMRRVAGRLATLIMIGLSALASLRYLYWRVTSTLGFEYWLDGLFGYGLFLAELYAILVLLLGYLQTAWPLRRRPVALPADSGQWPTVDIFIPTYNEPLNVVKQTVFTALAMDWPADKLKVYLLDDGRRPEFREFCEEAGAIYLTRPDNQHAKAGNLNAALAISEGEFVAVFDCDHVPTRSFLQVTMGWFLRDAKLAMLQTPHVFFSPDPFERNLNTFGAVPNEGELFYGVVQDGNDLWNATFFCGSCAVLRRASLMEVGGVAIETVTEDAHTALKLNRAGYNTAYLALPQAAGLATESLGGHIGQRVRWARGMAQIFRVDNPLFGRGLRLFQRLCYLNAMLHFFYGLPRLVFLTAPLAYLFAGAYIFHAPAILIVGYAVPHLLHAFMTNSRVQGQFRHSFWNEVYESVLAWYLMRPVLAAVIKPEQGKFNVTAKGGLVEQSYFAWDLAKPYIVLLTLNLAGLFWGLYRLVSGTALVEGELATLLINLAWTCYNVLISSVSAAVAAETRQLRVDPRVASSLRASIRLPNGRTIACKTSDFSQSGVGLMLPPGVSVDLHQPVQISLFRDAEEGVFPGKVVFSANQRLGVRFEELDLAQQAELAALTFARADTWALAWGRKTRRDTPLRALRDILRIGARGLVVLVTHGSRYATDAVRGRRAASPAPQSKGVES